jgi:hypothetical protein
MIHYLSLQCDTLSLSLSILISAFFLYSLSCVFYDIFCCGATALIEKGCSSPFGQVLSTDKKHMLVYFAISLYFFSPVCSRQGFRLLQTEYEFGNSDADHNRTPVFILLQLNLLLKHVTVFQIYFLCL